MVEQAVWSICFCLTIRQNVCPTDTPVCICPFAGVLILGIEGCFLCVRLVPVVPSFGSYVFAKTAADEDCLCVRTPRSAEIDLRNLRVSGEVAIEEGVA